MRVGDPIGYATIRVQVQLPIRLLINVGAPWSFALEAALNEKLKEPSASIHVGLRGQERVPEFSCAQELYGLDGPLRKIRD